VSHDRMRPCLGKVRLFKGKVVCFPTVRSNALQDARSYEPNFSVRE
jgi:hypothetical protein